MSDEKQVKRPGMMARISSAYDRCLETFAPEKAARNQYARQMMSLSNDFFSSGGGFDAADRSSREMGSWIPFGSDADTSMLGHDDMVSRSRDAVRNQPLAGGIVNTTVMNAVGVGLTFQSRIDRDLLKMSNEEADAWQTHTERRFRLWAESKDCDLERTLNFNGHTQLALRCRIVNGEAITLLPLVDLPGLSNPVRIQAIESDRLANPAGTPDRKGLVRGIQKDQYGAPEIYHILRSHPGNLAYADAEKLVTDPYPAFNPNTGLRNVLHYYRPERPGQSRGFPMLAPILEPLKDIARMSKAELKRAVVAGLFTAFITDNGQPLANMPFAPGGASYPGGMTVAPGAGDKSGESASTTGNIRLGYGAVVALGKNQKVELADPKLPNPNFDPFFLANVRQIGLQIGIPYEVLIKHYTASYSAARAAMEDAWKFFFFIRAELIIDHCDPILAVWMAQEVAQGTIYAPGFFADPMIRAAYLGREWIGPSKPIINPVDEAEGAERRSALGITTLSQETAAMNGGDWDTNMKRAAKEREMLREAGMGPVNKMGDTKPQPNPDKPETPEET